MDEYIAERPKLLIWSKNTYKQKEKKEWRVRSGEYKEKGRGGRST
jgi:hypothetical protein